MLGFNLEHVELVEALLNEDHPREICGVAGPSSALCLYDPAVTSGCPIHESVRNVAECYQRALDVYLHRQFFAFDFPMPIKTDHGN